MGVLRPVLTVVSIVAILFAPFFRLRLLLRPLPIIVVFPLAFRAVASSTTFRADARMTVGLAVTPVNRPVVVVAAYSLVSVVTSACTRKARSAGKRASVAQRGRARARECIRGSGSGSTTWGTERPCKRSADIRIHTC